MRHQLRRLSHHPSIVMLDACNECGGGKLWGSFVSPTIADEEPSRPLWPACPSNGWKSGVDRLTGLPNGRPLVQMGGNAARNARAESRAESRATRDAATCTHVKNVDYAHGTNWLDKTVADLAGCCDACTAQPGCFAGVFWQGVCYMKNATQVQVPSWSTGLDSVWIAGQTPITPSAGGCNTGLNMETHGYYQHGEGFLTVNSGASLQPFPANVPPVLDPPFITGPNTCPGTYASEFGASAWSSFESVSPTIDPSHWNTHADPMFERNYALDNFITAYFNVEWPAGIVALSLKAQLYLALVAQGLLVKSDISTRRARNSFGTVTWQWGEIWPTGGWGAIEYGTVGFTPGQVVGGRWKPLAHYFRQHLYTDLFATCGDDARCFVKNDGPLAPFSGALVLTLLNVSNSASIALSRTPIALGAGAGAGAWLCAAGGGSPWAATCTPWADLLAPLGAAPAGAVLLTSLESAAGETVYSSFELLAPPAAMLPALPVATVAAVVGAPAPDGASVNVTVTASDAALFVGLTTAAHGRFEPNFFVMARGQATVAFLPFGALDVATLASTLRVEHVRTYV